MRFCLFFTKLHKFAKSPLYKFTIVWYNRVNRKEPPSFCGDSQTQKEDTP